MNKKVYVTVEALKEKHACRAQIRLFKEIFGDECEISKENLLKALEVGLDAGFIVIIPEYKEAMKRACDNDPAFMCKWEIKASHVSDINKALALKVVEDRIIFKYRPLIGAFSWRRTPEGYDFWEQILDSRETRI